MLARTYHPRIALFAALAMLFACAADPAPRVKKKKRHRDRSALKREDDGELSEEARERERERAERKKAREELREEAKERERDKERGRDRDKERDKQRAQEREAEAEQEREKRDSKARDKKQRARDQESDEDRVVVTEDSDVDEPVRARNKVKGRTKAKEVAAAEAEQEAAPKPNKKPNKKAAAPPPEPEEEVAPKPKKKKATEPPPEEEVAPKPKKKKATEPPPEPEEEVAPKPKKKKATEPPPEPEEVAPKPKKKKATEPPPEPEEVAPKPKKKKATEPESEEEVAPPPARTKGRASDPVDETLIEMDTEPAEARVAAMAVPGVDSDAPSVSDTPEASAPATGWPLAIHDRPLTLASGKLAVHGGLPVSVLTLPGTMAGTTVTTTSVGLALGATYGVGAHLEIGADYTPSLSPGSAKGPITLRGAYLAVDHANLDVAISAALAVDFSDLTDPATMVTTTQTNFGLQLGAWARYHATRKVSVFTGLPALPNHSVSLSKLSIPLPPIPNQLVVGLNNGGTVALDLPVGVGFQATRAVYAFTVLNLAHIRIANTQNAIVFADFIPLAIGGFYSLTDFDLGAVFADDLKQGTDYLRFDLVARYYVK